MKLKQIIVIAAMFMSTTAFAQFTQNGTKNQSPVEKGWNSIYVSYNMLKYSQAAILEMWDSGYNKAYNGLSVGYDRAIALTSRLPLYIEVGGAIQYARQHIKEDDGSVNINLLSGKIPVSVLYRWNIFGSNWSIVPKAGFDGRINIWGEEEDSYKNWKDELEKQRYSIFKEDDGLYGEAKCSRFQVGWHIGADIEYDSLFLGITYGADMNAFCKEIARIHFKTLTIAFGYKF